MSSVSRLVLIKLDGSVPPELNLPPLRTLSASCNSVLATFTPYLLGENAINEVNSREDLSNIPSAPGLTVIYLVGHAWIEGQQYLVSLRTREGSKVISGRELATWLLAPFSISTDLILLIDTCNASALINEIKSLRLGTNSCVIAASSQGETTLEYPLDRTTRFAAALQASLERRLPSTIDALELSSEICKRLGRHGIMPSQAAAYWISGDPIRIEPGAQAPKSGTRISKTYLVLRSLLIASGIIISALAVWAFVYYRAHVLVTLQLPNFKSITNSVSIEIREESPERDQSNKIIEIPVLTLRRLQFRLPASDLLVITKAAYKDEEPREIRFHVNLAPGLNWSKKNVFLSWPSAEEIRLHPNMAYIAPTEWEQGTARQVSKLERAFWIDLYPVSAHIYRPIAIEAERNGDIQYSVLLNTERNAAAVTVTGTEQVPKLMGDLNKIFDVINANQRAQAQPPSKAKQSASSDTQLSANTPCADCPAPLTMEEAQFFCKKRGMRLPTDLEWELAARGVDGRLYPWGNKFDAQRTNSVGLPDKDQASPSLQPSGKFISGASPFGVIDMVGNAGDWVDTRGGYERTFMGGFYVFNPEECMVFKSLPDTGEPPWRTITARCVQVSADVKKQEEH